MALTPSSAVTPFVPIRQSLTWEVWPSNPLCVSGPPRFSINKSSGECFLDPYTPSLSRVINCTGDSNAARIATFNDSTGTCPGGSLLSISAPLLQGTCTSGGVVRCFSTSPLSPSASSLPLRPSASSTQGNSPRFSQSQTQTPSLSNPTTSILPSQPYVSATSTNALPFSGTASCSSSPFLNSQSPSPAATTARPYPSTDLWSDTMSPSASDSFGGSGGSFPASCRDGFLVS